MLYSRQKTFTREGNHIPKKYGGAVGCAVYAYANAICLSGQADLDNRLESISSTGSLGSISRLRDVNAGTINASPSADISGCPPSVNLSSELRLSGVIGRTAGRSPGKCNDRISKFRLHPNIDNTRSTVRCVVGTARSVNCLRLVWKIGL